MQVIWSLVSISFDTHNLAHNKNKLCKTLDYWSREMNNFDFLEKGPAPTSSTNIGIGSLVPRINSL